MAEAARSQNRGETSPKGKSSLSQTKHGAQNKVGLEPLGVLGSPSPGCLASAHTWPRSCKHQRLWAPHSV